MVLDEFEAACYSEAIAVKTEGMIRMKTFRLRTLSLVIFWMACWSSIGYAQLTFDKPKTEKPLDNPYTIGSKREDILKATREILKACAIPINEEASKANEGRIVTQFVVYTRGITAKSDLEHLATLPASDVRNWLQGRYNLEITALPLDQNRSQLQIISHIQGRIASVIESEKWIDGTTNGTLEDEVLRGLAGKILGIDLTIKGKGQRRILNCEY